MPLKPHPTDPDKMVYASRQYDIPQLQGVTTTQRPWVGLMRGVRVEGNTVVISVKGGNDAARELCGALVEELNK